MGATDADPVVKNGYRLLDALVGAGGAEVSSGHVCRFCRSSCPGLLPGAVVEVREGKCREVDRLGPTSKLQLKKVERRVSP